MSKLKNVLILIGSPKGPSSTSKALADYLVSELNNFGLKSKTAYLHRMVFREKKQQEFLTLINKSDLIILSFPLYVDSFPAPVIKAMELISNNKDILSPLSEKNFIAISNCGFPESKQIDTVIDMCKLFCEKVGFYWKGGLELGGGAFIRGRPLEDIGGMAQNLRESLQIAAEKLANGEEIPQKARDLFSEPNIPTKIYKMMGNLGWRMQGLGNKNMFNLKQKPYKDEKS
ncbi:MAG: hypothetical protein GF317_01560 [Candidatus Lokiarchaeota archaeon]|nr:hypothetical protein [Candidatus Lokiarchaeota archaeon]MBD3198631.1 hypothetical protein [Candidatus Lokiarchaeota archaeon]